MADTSYVLGRKIGEGKNSEVYLIKNQEGVQFAAKKVKIGHNGIIEVDLMLRLNHPNILKGIELVSIDLELYLVIELGIPLDSLMRYLDEKDKMRIIFGLGSALQYFQSNGLVHCDIKPDNVICVNGHCKIADLGLTQYHSVNSGQICTVILYRSPESLYGTDDHRHKHAYHSEIWSFGMLCLDILYGDVFVIGDSFREMMASPDVKNFIVNKLGYPSNRDIFNLVCDKLLQVDVKDRIKTFDEFIMEDLFKSNGFQVGIEFPISESSSDMGNVISEEDKQYFLISADWLSEVMAEIRLHNKIAFIAHDLIRYHWNEYVDTILRRRDIQLFVASCIYLSIEICADTRVDTLEFLSEMTDYAYSPNEIFDYSSMMLVRMGGMIGRNTLYDYLPSLDMLIAALKMMKSDYYLNMNRKQFTEMVIASETVHNANNRLSKDSGNYTHVHTASLVPLGSHPFPSY